MALISTSFARGLVAPTALTGVSNKRTSLQLTDSVTGAGSSELDLTWLASESSQYDLSPYIKDYVVVPVPAEISGVPNSNGEASPLKELMAVNSGHDVPAYKTYIRKPTYVEHQSQIKREAKGLILDSILKPCRGYGPNHARMILLLAFDRTKDSVLANSILTGRDNCYSTGKYYKAYECSICGAVSTGEQACEHTHRRQKPYMIGSQLCYRNLINLTGYECSSVSDPAFVSALNTKGKILAPGRA